MDHEYWHHQALEIVAGRAVLVPSHMIEIAKLLEFQNMIPSFYPTKALSSRSITSRKIAINDLSTRLWGITPETWLVNERAWLDRVRRKNGITRDDGKDELNDVISTEVLIRIFSVSYLFYQAKEGILPIHTDDVPGVLFMALRGLNSFLEIPLSKGLARTTLVRHDLDNTVSIYGFLIDAGIPVSASGHYLPNPEKSFPRLLYLLDRKKLRPEVYYK